MLTLPSHYGKSVVFLCVWFRIVALADYQSNPHFQCGVALNGIERFPLKKGKREAAANRPPGQKSERKTALFSAKRQAV